MHRRVWAHKRMFLENRRFGPREATSAPGDAAPAHSPLRRRATAPAAPRGAAQPWWGWRAAPLSASLYVSLGAFDSDSSGRQEAVQFARRHRMSKESGLCRGQRRGCDARLPVLASLRPELPRGLPPRAARTPKGPRSLPGARPPPRWECLAALTPFPGRPPAAPGHLGDPCSLCIAAPSGLPCFFHSLTGPVSARECPSQSLVQGT